MEVNLLGFSIKLICTVLLLLIGYLKMEIQPYMLVLEMKRTWDAKIMTENRQWPLHERGWHRVLTFHCSELLQCCCCWWRIQLPWFWDGEVAQTKRLWKGWKTHINMNSCVCFLLFG